MGNLNSFAKAVETNLSDGTGTSEEREMSGKRFLMTAQLDRVFTYCGNVWVGLRYDVLLLRWLGA
jgi:hypothetical protein